MVFSSKTAGFSADDQFGVSSMALRRDSLDCACKEAVKIRPRSKLQNHFRIISIRFSCVSGGVRTRTTQSFCVRSYTFHQRLGNRLPRLRGSDELFVLWVAD